MDMLSGGVPGTAKYESRLMHIGNISPKRLPIIDPLKSISHQGNIIVQEIIENF